MLSFMEQTHLDPACPPPRASTDPQEDPRRLGEFVILRRLGQGGMGSVYLAYHEVLGQQVAIKVLPDQLAGKQDLVDRFYREAKSGALLNHPNIVRTMLVGQDQVTNKHYLVLEYIDGPSAHAILDQNGHLSVGDAVHIVLDIARALEHAHSRNVIHRDIKPDNILITQSGVCKLADLGLAKRMDEASHLTFVGKAFGTSYYMPYEQAMNVKKADFRSDIYALGATLYHLLTGEVPFPGENHFEVVDKKAEGKFIPASDLNPDVPAELDAIISRMMAREPHDRYQTATELLIDLERSNLAAMVLSFVNPDLALQDPWARACMVSSAQPTRPDLESPSAKLKIATEAAAPWLLRFRGKGGRWFRIRTTMKEIADRLRDGRLPEDSQASRGSASELRPIREFPEFRGITCRRSRRRKPKSASKANSTFSAPPSLNGHARVVADKHEIPPGRRPLFWTVAGIALLAGLSLTVYLIVHAFK
jgi:serine/threonine-protein kinase